MADDRRTCTPGVKGMEKAGVTSIVGGAADRESAEVKKLSLDYVRSYRVTCKGVGKVWSAGDQRNTGKEPDGVKLRIKLESACAGDPILARSLNVTLQRNVCDFGRGRPHVYCLYLTLNSTRSPWGWSRLIPNRAWVAANCHLNNSWSRYNGEEG